MFRSIVFRGLPYRAASAFGASGSFRGSSKKRYASSSRRNMTGGNLGAISFGALVTLGAIFFILPCNVKILLPKAQKPEQVKTESKANLNPNEVPKSQAPSDNNPVESTKDEKSTAYNPDTGEINWDCPCLGGMAHGPCGEEFKAAFACFVYSEAEPKGIDCVTKFQQMQDCFREHPEHYAEQLRDEDEAGTGEPVEVGTGEPVEVGTGEPVEVGTGEPVEVGTGEPVEAGADEPVEAEVVEVDVEVPERQESEKSTDPASTEPAFTEPLSTEPVVEPIEERVAEPVEDTEPALLGISEPSQDPIVGETEVVIVDIPEEETK